MTAPAFGAVHRRSLVLALRTAIVASWISGAGTSGMSAFPVFVYSHGVLLQVVSRVQKFILPTIGRFFSCCLEATLSVRPSFQPLPGWGR